jgi:polysaccharide transporter, PST family
MPKKLFNKMKHPILENSFYLYISHFADYLFSILILPLIARILGPNELSQVVLAQTFGLLILIIMEFGFSLTATREVALLKNQKEALVKYLGKAFSFKLFLVPVVFILSFILIKFPVFQSKTHYIYIVLIGSIFQGMVPIWFFQGIERLKIVAFSKIFFRAIGFIIIFIFVNDEQDGWIVLMSHTITSGLIFIYFIYSMFKIVGRIKLSKLKHLNVIWNNSSWLFLLSIIPVIFQNSAAFLLELKLSSFQLGLYFGTFKIYRSFNTLYGPIGQVVYPRLISSNVEDKESSIKLKWKVFWVLLSLGLFFCCILIFFPKIIISILLGNEYLEASITLQLFGLVLPLTAISHVLGRQWMLVQRNEKKYSIILIIGLLISFIFLLFSVNKLGIQSIPISLILYELSTILMIIKSK